MTKQRRRLLLGALCGILAASVIVGLRISAAEDASAIETAKTWARLAPFPATAHDLHVKILGSMFTREFVITFVVPPRDLATWIQQSPGPASAKQSTDGSETVYEIVPGGGAGFSEIRVEPETGKVSIKTNWS